MKTENENKIKNENKNIIWIENIHWGWLISVIFLYTIPTDFINSFLVGCLGGYLIGGSHYTLLGFIVLHFLVNLIIKYAEHWIVIYLIIGSLIGGYIYGLMIAILEGQYWRQEMRINKKNNNLELENNNLELENNNLELENKESEIISFEIYSCYVPKYYMLIDSLATQLLKWKISNDFSISNCLRTIYKSFIRQSVYNNDILLRNK